MKRNLIHIIGCVALIIAFGSIGHADDERRDFLSSDQEVGPAANDSGSFGLASLEIDFEDDEACLEVEFALRIKAGTEITRVHIHRGAAGENGPIEVFFFDTVVQPPQNPDPIPVNDGKAFVSFEECVSKSLGDEIDDFPERFYYNVHTPENPAGELRGQLSDGGDNDDEGNDNSGATMTNN